MLKIHAIIAVNHTAMVAVRSCAKYANGYRYSGRDGSEIDVPFKSYRKFKQGFPVSGLLRQPILSHSAGPSAKPKDQLVTLVSYVR